MDTKQYYFQLLVDKLTALYRDKQAGLPIAQLRADLNGYLQAALVLAVATNQELQQIIDEVYFKAYGKHRRERDSGLTELDTHDIDWTYFDKPRWER